MTADTLQWIAIAALFAASVANMIVIGALWAVFDRIRAAAGEDDPPLSMLGERGYTSRSMS